MRAHTMFPVLLICTWLAGGAGSETLSAAGTPPGPQAPAAPAAPPTLDMASQMQSQFQTIRRLMTALADRMPADDYGFTPTHDMRPFAQGVAHVVATNFGFCANLTGQPNPHKGTDLEKTIATKADATRLLTESYDFCGAFASKPTAASITATYPATSVKANGDRTSIAVERGGLFANFLEHNNEMYGYLSVYLRLKGLVPPSSDPRPGRSGGAGGAK